MTASRPLLALALASGCSPAAGPTFGQGGQPIPRWALEGWYQDSFTATSEICGSPDGFHPYDAVWGDNGSTISWTLLVSDACQQALLADLRVEWDPDAGWPAGWPDGLSFATWFGAYALLSWPMGTVDEPRSHDDELSRHYLREPLIAELERLSEITGEERVGPLAHNMVTSSIAGLVLEPTPTTRRTPAPTCAHAPSTSPATITSWITHGCWSTRRRTCGSSSPTCPVRTSACPTSRSMDWSSATMTGPAPVATKQAWCG